MQIGGGVVGSNQTHSLDYKAVNHTARVPAHSSWSGCVSRVGWSGWGQRRATRWQLDHKETHRSQAGSRVYIQRETCLRKVKGPRCRRTGKLGKSKRWCVTPYTFNMYMHIWFNDVIIMLSRTTIVRGLSGILYWGKCFVFMRCFTILSFRYISFTFNVYCVYVIREKYFSVCIVAFFSTIDVNACGCQQLWDIISELVITNGQFY